MIAWGINCQMSVLLHIRECMIWFSTSRTHKILPLAHFTFLVNVAIFSINKHSSFCIRVRFKFKVFKWLVRDECIVTRLTSLVGLTTRAEGSSLDSVPIPVAWPANFGAVACRCRPWGRGKSRCALARAQAALASASTWILTTLLGQPSRAPALPIAERRPERGPAGEA